MSSSINKETLEHLAKLARLKLQPDEEEKLLADLSNILKHVSVLEGLNLENVPPAMGGGKLKNIFREDTEKIGTNQGDGKESFPEKVGDFLKVPPVFE